MSIEQQRRAIEEARQKLTAGLGALFDRDGNRIYADAEHERREQELRTEYERALLAAGQEASRIAAHAEAEIDRHYGDPIESMSAADLQTANARQPFIAENYRTLPLAELVGQAEAAIRDGDRPTRYLHWRYAAQRLREMSEIRRDPASGTYHSVSHDPTTRRLVATLATLVERLERSLIDVDARQRAREEATALRDEAFDLAGQISTQGYMNRTYREPPASLRWRR
jgi:hypothetical protein